MIWKTLRSKIAFDGQPFFQLFEETYEREDGKILEPWYHIKNENFVVVFPITNRNTVIMVSQYRPGAKKYSIELPSGRIELDETSSEAAVRELREETGYASQNLQQIGKRIWEDPSLRTGQFDVFIGLDCIKIGDQMLDETEDIQVVEKPIAEVFEMALTGEIITPASIVAVFWAMSSKMLKP